MRQVSKFEKRVTLSTLIFDKIDLRKRVDVENWLIAINTYNTTIHHFIDIDIEKLKALNFKELKAQYQNILSKAMDEHAINLR